MPKINPLFQHTPELHRMQDTQDEIKQLNHLLVWMQLRRNDKIILCVESNDSEDDQTYQPLGMNNCRLLCEYFDIHYEELQNEIKLLAACDTETSKLMDMCTELSLFG